MMYNVEKIVSAGSKSYVLYVHDKKVKSPTNSKVKNGNNSMWTVVKSYEELALFDSEARKRFGSFFEGVIFPVSELTDDAFILLLLGYFSTILSDERCMGHTAVQIAFQSFVTKFLVTKSNKLIATEVKNQANPSYDSNEVNPIPAKSIKKQISSPNYESFKFSKSESQDLGSERTSCTAIHINCVLM